MKHVETNLPELFIEDWQAMTQNEVLGYFIDVKKLLNEAIHYKLNPHDIDKWQKIKTNVRDYLLVIGMGQNAE